MLPLAIAILPPELLLTSSSHSFLCQGLYTGYPSTSAQPLVTEPLAVRPGTPPGLAGKSQLCCQATAGGPSGSCLPRPGPPRVRSKPPRPWPGAHTSSPAQMPPGSRRVGTCPRPRAGIGTRAARPPHLCLPSWLSAFQFSVPPWARAAAPTPGAAGSPRAVVSPAPLQRKSPTVGAVPPVPVLGWRSTERQVGGQTGLGSGMRGAAGAGGVCTEPAQQTQDSPARPSPGPEPRRGCAPAKTKATSCNNFAAEGADEKLCGAALGDGERAAGRDGQRRPGAVLP